MRLSVAVAVVLAVLVGAAPASRADSGERAGASKASEPIVAPTPEAPSPRYATQRRSLLVIPWWCSTWPGDPVPEPSTAEYEAIAQEVAEWYLAVSRSRLVLVPEVTPTVDVCASGEQLLEFDWETPETIVAGLGYDADAFDFIALPGRRVPDNDAVAESAPGRRFTAAGESAVAVGTWIHELGHLLGLHHALGIDCADDVGAVAYDLAVSCSLLAWGGGHSSVMGVGVSALRRGFSAPEMARLGWLSAGEVATPAGPGVFETALVPLHGGLPGVRAVRVPTSGGVVFVEVRTAEGVDASFGEAPGLTDGVLVHVADPQYEIPGFPVPAQSVLVDMTPATATLADAALPFGSIGRVGGLKVLAQQVGGSVVVSVSVPPGVASPPQPTSVAWSVDGSTGTGTASWSAPAAGASSYRVRLPDGSSTVVAGTALTVDSLPDGWSQIDVATLDDAGNASAPVSSPPRWASAPTIAPESVVVSEPGAGAVDVEIPMGLGWQPSNVASRWIVAVGVTATEGSDFQVLEDSVAFPGDPAAGVYRLRILGDQVAEGTEVVEIRELRPVCEAGDAAGLLPGCMSSVLLTRVVILSDE